MHEQHAATLRPPDARHDRQRQITIIRDPRRQRKGPQSRPHREPRPTPDDARQQDPTRRRAEAHQRRQHHVVRRLQRRVARHRFKNETRETHVHHQPQQTRLRLALDPMHPPHHDPDRDQRKHRENQLQQLPIRHHEKRAPITKPEPPPRKRQASTRVLTAPLIFFRPLRHPRPTASAAARPSTNTPPPIPPTAPTSIKQKTARTASNARSPKPRPPTTRRTPPSPPNLASTSASPSPSQTSSPETNSFSEV